jgi:hypothetical protein
MFFAWKEMMYKFTEREALMAKKVEAKKATKKAAKPAAKTKK